MPLSSKINVLFVHPTPHLNGVTWELAEVINWLDPGLFQISIALPPSSALEDLLRRSDIELGYFQMPNLGRHPAQVVRHFVSGISESHAMSHFAKRLRADLIYGNTIMATWALRVAARLRLPCVIHVHEGPHSFPAFIYRHWVRAVGRDADLILVVYDEIREAFRAYSQKVVRVDPGFDFTRFNRLALRQRPASRRGSNFHILCVSHLMSGKGQHEIVKQLPAIVEKCAGAHVTFVGGTNGVRRNEEYVQSLKEMADGLGVLDRIRFVGPQKETADWFRTCDAFVNTSPYETFGRTVIEALAAGVPVISKLVGIVGRLKDQATPGLYVIERSWDELPALLSEIDSSGFTDYRAQRNEILRPYQIEFHAEGIAVLLKRLVSRS